VTLFFGSCNFVDRFVYSQKNWSRKQDVAPFYSGHPWLAEDIKERGIDELIPVWNVLDLTRQGGDSWYASLEYGIKVQGVQAARG
jgi:predicted dithiol-disulfide oxidoreductase (DUF899 family)